MNDDRAFSEIVAVAGQRANAETLSAAAQQVLTILDEDIARVVSIKVTTDGQADTAMTDGIRIVMPQSYAGVELAQHPELALGLLAHECGHMLQPLAELNELVNSNQAPHWLTNIAMDINGEALIQNLFPPFALPLQAMRTAGLKTFWKTVHKKFKAATSFRECAAYAALLMRMCEPQSLKGRIADLNFLHDLPRESMAAQSKVELADFLSQLKNMGQYPAIVLPKEIQHIVQAFPELLEPPPPPQSSAGGDANGEQEQRGDGQKDSGRNKDSGADESVDTSAEGNSQPSGTDIAPDLIAAPRVSGELLKALGQFLHIAHTPVMGSNIDVVGCFSRPPLPQAQKIARQISERYARPKGAVATIGSQRFDRLDAARGLMPFKLDVAHPQADTPAPQVCLCIDTSGSMGGLNLDSATIAAQALTLAIRSTDGDVRVLAFSDNGYCAKDFGATLVFSGLQSGGGTSFCWLSKAWAEMPKHLFILLTDGEGQMPGYVSARNKERTLGILLPGGNAELLSTVCRKVVSLDQPNDLPAVMAMLVPRTLIA